METITSKAPAPGQLSSTYADFINNRGATRTFLLIALIATSTLSLLAAIWDVSHAIWLIGFVAPASAVLLLVHRAGKVRWAGRGLCLLIPVATTVNLLAGNGLNDPGVLGFAITIVFGALLGGRKAILPLAITTIGLSAVVFVAEQNGGFGPFRISGSMVATTFDLAVVVILILVTSTLLFMIIGIVEKVLAQVQRSEADLIEAYDLTLEGWARALELRDKETEGHSRRVTDLTLRVATKLGYSDLELQQIRRGALLHDIGKMGIPDEILNKPSALDADEWEIVKQHTIYARDLLSPIHFLADSIAIPYSHHEAWDGSGYPEGLKGEAIPRVARIFALADSWDALTSDRPYRAAWTSERTEKHMQAESGKQFDPELVPVFLSIANEKLSH